MGSRPRTNRREPLQSKGFPCYFGVRASVSLTGSSTEDGSSNLGRKSNKSVGRRRDGEGGEGQGEEKKKKKRTNDATPRTNRHRRARSISDRIVSPLIFILDRLVFTEKKIQRPKPRLTSLKSTHTLPIMDIFCILLK